MKKFVPLILLFIPILILFVSAVDFFPQGDIIGRDVRDIYGFVWINGSNISADYFFGDGSLLTGISATSGTEGWNITGSDYLYNNSGILDWNESILWLMVYNETETDALLAAQDACSEITGCVENAVTNSTVNESTYCSNIDGATSNLCTLTDTDTTYDYSDWQLLNRSTYTHLSNFTNDGVFLTNSTVNKTSLWTDLESYPAACPGGSYLSQLDDSVTCTAAMTTYATYFDQYLNTTSSPTFAGVTLSDDLVINDGQTINHSTTDGTIRYFSNGCYEKVNTTGLYWIC